MTGVVASYGTLSYSQYKLAHTNAMTGTGSTGMLRYKVIRLLK